MSWPTAEQQLHDDLQAANAREAAAIARADRAEDENARLRAELDAAHQAIGKTIDALSDWSRGTR